MVASGSMRVTTTLIRPLCARNGQSHAKWPARRGGACSAATPPRPGEPHGHDEPVLCHLKRRRRLPEGARYRE